MPGRKKIGILSLKGKKLINFFLHLIHNATRQPRRLIKFRVWTNQNS